MDFGVFLPNYGPLSSTDAIEKIAIASERLGYGFVAVCDHVFIQPEAGKTHINAGAVELYPKYRSSANWFDAVATLGFVAALTKRVKLLTNIYLLPLRHPLISARGLTTIDQLSNGRLIIGIGVGWFKKEYDVLGVNWSERGKQIDEYIEVMKTLWTRRIASFRGQYVNFEDIHFYPKPVQRPHPPIWVGGYVNDGIKIKSTTKVLKRVVRVGSGWVPSVASPDELSKGVGLIRGFCEEAGRAFNSIRIVSQNLISIARDDKRAKDKAKITLMTRFGSVANGLGKNLVGSPENVKHQVKRFIDSGATDFMLGFISKDLDEFLSDIEIFAKEVRPYFE